jgi:hypothetical protein
MNRNFTMPYSIARDLTLTALLSPSELVSIGRLILSRGTAEDCDTIARIYERLGDAAVAATYRSYKDVN